MQVLDSDSHVNGINELTRVHISILNYIKLCASR